MLSQVLAVLSAFGDFDGNTYVAHRSCDLSLSFQASAVCVDVFITLIEASLVCRGTKPVRYSRGDENICRLFEDLRKGIRGHTQFI